jgi:lysophospholipase L1-like esterase
MKKVTFILVALFVSLPLFAQSNPDPHRFDKEIEYFRTWDSKNAIPDNHILFVGSSSIRMWKSAESFPDLPVVNRGFGGAHISDMLFFKQDILLKYGAPSCIVFFCGGNDVSGKKPAEQVLADFKTWWNLVQGNFPGTPLIFIPIKPCPSRWDIWPEESKVNAAVLEMSKEDKFLYYADTATPMLETGQPPAEDLFIADLLHLSDKGYAIWTGVVQDVLDDILN